MAQNGFTEELFVSCCLSCVGICILSSWPSSKHAMIFLKHSAADRPSNFLRSRQNSSACVVAYPKTHHLRPHARFFFVVIPQPLQSLTSVSRVAGEVYLLAGACVAQNGFTEELFVSCCLSCVGICISFLLAKRQTCYDFFEAECC